MNTVLRKKEKLTLHQAVYFLCTSIKFSPYNNSQKVIRSMTFSEVVLKHTQAQNPLGPYETSFLFMTVNDSN